MSINLRLRNSIYLSLSFFTAIGLAQQAHAYVSREDIIAHNRALAAGDDQADLKFVDEDNDPQETDANQAVNSNKNLDVPDQLAPPTAEVKSSHSVATPASVASSEVPASSGSSNLTVRLLERVDAQERLTADLRGQLETLKNEMQLKLSQADKNIGDLKFQVDELEKRLKEQAVHHQPVAVGTKAKVATAVTKPTSSPEAAAKKSLAVAKTPAQKLHAQYALATAQFGGKSYKQAAVSYYDAYKISPKSSVAPQALLGLSRSMALMNNRTASCQALSKLHSEFPNLAQPLAEQSKTLATREKC